MITTDLYRDHLATLDTMLADALDRAAKRGVTIDAVLFHAGREREYHRDDEIIAFHPTPHYRRWIPVDGPEHVVLARPGATPKVVLVQPRDFWFDTSPPPASYWQDAVDLAVVERLEQVVDVLGGLDRVAYIGNAPDAAAQFGIPGAMIEPDELVMPLDWHRSYKTPYEVAHLRIAADMTGKGHDAARAAFEGGGSEREILWAYLAGTGHTEVELPYPAIIALDHKGAILHYQHKRGREAAPGKVLLIDAGAQHAGYAIDITRTWVVDDIDPVFRTILERMDAFERDLVAMCMPGRPYLDIHLESHRQVAALLAETGIVNGGADEILELGLTRAFYPHGVGHHLGLQVHDVAGRQAGPDGGTVAPPDDHPFLRNTRTMETGHVLTVEPGFYFTPVLLDELRAGPHAARVDWSIVDRLTPLGGVRIEDDVLVTDGEPEDLTRSFAPGPRGT